jgi:hypothetical protein
MSVEASIPVAVRLMFIALAAAITIAAAVMKTSRVAGTWETPAAGGVVSVVPSPPATVRRGDDLVITGWVTSDRTDPARRIDAVVDGERTETGVATLGGGTGPRRTFTARIGTRGVEAGIHHASLWVQTRSARSAPLPLSIGFAVGT